MFLDHSECILSIFQPSIWSLWILKQQNGVVLFRTRTHTGTPVSWIVSQSSEFGQFYLTNCNYIMVTGNKNVFFLDVNMKYTQRTTESFPCIVIVLSVNSMTHIRLDICNGALAASLWSFWHQWLSLDGSNLLHS